MLGKRLINSTLDRLTRQGTRERNVEETWPACTPLAASLLAGTEVPSGSIGRKLGGHCGPATC